MYGLRLSPATEGRQCSVGDAPYIPAAGKGGGKGDVARAEGGKTLSTKDLSLMVKQMNKLLLARGDSILNLASIALVTFLLPEESPSMAAGRSEG